MVRALLAWEAVWCHPQGSPAGGLGSFWNQWVTSLASSSVGDFAFNASVVLTCGIWSWSRALAWSLWPGGLEFTGVLFL